jgi:hypothetical protein
VQLQQLEMRTAPDIFTSDHKPVYSVFRLSAQPRPLSLDRTRASTALFSIDGLEITQRNFDDTKFKKSKHSPCIAVSNTCFSEFYRQAVVDSLHGELVGADVLGKLQRIDLQATSLARLESEVLIFHVYTKGTHKKSSSANLLGAGRAQLVRRAPESAAGGDAGDDKNQDPSVQQPEQIVFSFECDLVDKGSKKMGSIKGTAHVEWGCAGGESPSSPSSTDAKEFSSFMHIHGGAEEFDFYARRLASTPIGMVRKVRTLSIETAQQLVRARSQTEMGEAPGEIKEDASYTDDQLLPPTAAVADTDDLFAPAQIDVLEQKELRGHRARAQSTRTEKVHEQKVHGRARSHTTILPCAAAAGIMSELAGSEQKVHEQKVHGRARSQTNSGLIPPPVPKSPRRRIGPSPRDRPSMPPPLPPRVSISHTTEASTPVVDTEAPPLAPQNGE